MKVKRIYAHFSYLKEKCEKNDIIIKKKKENGRTRKRRTEDCQMHTDMSHF